MEQNLPLKSSFAQNTYYLFMATIDAINFAFAGSIFQIEDFRHFPSPNNHESFKLNLKKNLCPKCCL